MLPKMSLWIISWIFLLPVGFAGQTPSGSTPTAPDVVRIRAEIERIQQAMPKIADKGAGLFLLAKEYVQLGDMPKALSLLKECVSLDEGFDPSGSATLEPLQSFPEFRELVAQVRRHRPAAHRARVAFTVPESDLFPEGLGVDPDKHVFYMGSMHRKKIVMIKENGEVSDFVKPELYNLLGLGRFYFIANTGIANLKEDRIIDPKKLEPVHIAVVPLE
jgi:hypothetical protein